MHVELEQDPFGGCGGAVVLIVVLIVLLIVPLKGPVPVSEPRPGVCVAGKSLVIGVVFGCNSPPHYAFIDMLFIADAGRPRNHKYSMLTTA